MPYSKSNLETLNRIASVHESHGKPDYIQFGKIPEIKGIQYLEPVIRAIEAKRVLRIYYLPFYEDRPYFNEVHPYLIKEHDFRWYMVGMNEFRGEIRTYALDRIRDLQESQGIAYKEPGFDRESYFRYAIGIIAPGGEPEPILLSVQKTQAQYLITKPWHESQNIERETDETVVFSFRVHPTYEFRSLVLSLGKDAEVLEPETLRRAIREEVRSMMGLYGDR
jgi:predicted DNA-binding transcriptional regulator YafY